MVGVNCQQQKSRFAATKGAVDFATVGMTSCTLSGYVRFFYKKLCSIDRVQTSKMF
jgi:hypothetical protein